MSVFGNDTNRCPFYKATDDALPTAHKWRSGRFMPRWAARIWIEVTAVRVERVQSITEDDAKAEGVEAVISKKIHGWTPHVLEYSLLWDQINGKGSWEANPWVFAYTFKRIERPKDI